MTAVMPNSGRVANGAIVLGVGGLHVTATPGAVLKTFALGSCVALLLHDPAKQVAGMAHIALPDSAINTTRAKELPGYFADSAIAELLSQMARLRGAGGGRLSVKLVGGATILKAHSRFNIGKRNVEAVCEHLARHRLSLKARDVGGIISRTVAMEVGSGTAHLSSPGRPSWDI